MSDKKEVEIKGTKFTIEKDVERLPHKGSPAPWKELVESMAIGDSVLLSRAEASRFQQGVRPHGYKVSVRKANEKEYRVWRTE